VTLAVAGVTKSFRGLKAVADASFDVADGAIVGLIGPNGAGKTTLFNVIAGVYAPDAGSVTFQGRSISGLRPDQVCAAGIGRTFQIVKPFAGLSVLDNVIVGALQRSKSVSAAKRHAAEIIAKLNLEAKRDLPASSLTLPDRKRLEVARALATRPAFILLDEPFAGVDPIAVLDIQRIIRFLKERAIGVLITDHNVRETLGICDRAYIMSEGAVLASGHPEEIVYNDSVRRVYLGEHFRM